MMIFTMDDLSVGLHLHKNRDIYSVFFVAMREFVPKISLLLHS